jgi:5,10-methylenetetrahydrofolate reductase
MASEYQSIKEARQNDRKRQEDEVAKRNKLMKEFNQTRDPIHLYTYNEIVKIRKWVAFFGVLLIISLILWLFITVTGWADI